MYLRECRIENVGPITALDLSLELNLDGTPKPVVVVGKNGTGKTILLAYVVDALAELAKKKFRDVVQDQRLGHMPFLKVTSGGDARSSSEGHLCLLEFVSSQVRFTYIEKVGSLDPASIRERLRGRFEAVRDWPKDEPFHKQVVGGEKQIEVFFQKGSVCFFPASRHERPHWLNKQAVEDLPVFGDFGRMQGYLGKPLIVERSAEINRQWLMDVLFDSMTDTQFIPSASTDPSAPLQYTSQLRCNVNEKILLQLGRENVENVLRQVVEDDKARLVPNYRTAAHGRVSIQLRTGVIVPSLAHLSAGQALLFNLFATIIRYADQGDLNKSIRLDQIEGVVLVDEIDAHLHADLQYSVLPRLIKLFPRVQFVVTSHAPLFLLGMEREFGAGGIQIVELPDGRAIGTERFEEFRRSFDAYQQTKAFEDQVEARVLGATKPLVLTEGQTDPVYIRTALQLLGHVDLLDLLEIDQVGTSGKGGTAGGGDSHLTKARSFLEHNHHRLNRRFLLLYDSDTGKPSAESGAYMQRAIPKNPANERVTKGIENLLPEVLFEKRFYSEKETALGDGGRKIVETLNKEEFCRWVCQERNQPSDFAKFGELVVPILQESIGHAVATDLPPTSVEAMTACVKE